MDNKSSNVIFSLKNEKKVHYSWLNKHFNFQGENIIDCMICSQKKTEPCLSRYIMYINANVIVSRY